MAFLDCVQYEDSLGAIFMKHCAIKTTSPHDMTHDDVMSHDVMTTLTCHAGLDLSWHDRIKDE